MESPTTTKNLGTMSEESESENDCDRLIAIQNELCGNLASLKFQEPIKYIYNPLIYAKNLQEKFIRKYFENSAKELLFLAENPGPWGMCQTGISFGEINYVKNWFRITGLVDTPASDVHPKKQILGLNCRRREISGKLFWGFFEELCGTPENFFKYSYVCNHCPLAFVDEPGKNITPCEIKDRNVRNQLIEICNDAFLKIVREFGFQKILAIGRYAEKVALKALKENNIVNVEVIYIPHPSPRNSKHKKNWKETALNILIENNLLKYFTTEEQENSTSQYFS